jgi:hypothetical protein
VSDLIDYYEQVRGYGARFALAAQAVKRCDLHPEIIEIVDSGQIGQACRMGNAAITRGEIDVERNDLTNAIKSIIDEAAYDCPRCEKIARE